MHKADRSNPFDQVFQTVQHVVDQRDPLLPPLEVTPMIAMVEVPAAQGG